MQLCEFNLEDEYKLLYRGREDGFNWDDFHSNCDDYANTLTIIKTLKGSFIFGGFTSTSWDCSGEYKSDPNAFLFSLTNKDNKPCKMEIDPNQHQYAIWCGTGWGPVFGEQNVDDQGNELDIGNFANTLESSVAFLGSTYKHPQYAYGTNEAQSFMAGSKTFKLSEIEVYQKE